MSPLAFKQRLQLECGQKKRGCPIRLCPPGSQKKNLVDSRVFQWQELSCHWCWGPRTPTMCPWRKGQSLEGWSVQVQGHFLRKPFVLGNTGLCPHLSRRSGQCVCPRGCVSTCWGTGQADLDQRYSPPTAGPGESGSVFESFCLCVSERWPVLSSWRGWGCRWGCGSHPGWCWLFGALVTSPRFHCFKSASRVGAWGCRLLALKKVFPSPFLTLVHSETIRHSLCHLSGKHPSCFT